jgi:DNA-binding response OmpR family regulator
LNVLILEDEWLIAEVLKDHLEEMGHRVVGPAMTCAAALEVLFRERPDIAVLDTQLGADTCEVVLEECQRQGIPVVISSGHSSAALPLFASGLPSLSKPYELGALTRVLGQVAG